MKNRLIFLLFPLLIFYRYIVFLKNLCYDKNLIKTNQLPCKVISIGNLTLGGTGKTPAVLHLCKILQENKYKDIAILTRGYKRNTNGTVLVSKGNGPLEDWQSVGDEPFMMAQKTKNIPIVVDNNRYRGGMLLVEEFNTKIIILDDGFQHRSLSRDLDIVLINGSTYPSDYSFSTIAPLRETWSSLKRADTIIFTKNKPKSILLKKIKEEKFFYVNSYLKSFVSISRGFNRKGRAVILSGIGDPKNFEETVKSQEILVVGIKTFGDHYLYTKSRLSKIIQFAKNLKADYIITTEKDWVKINPLNPDFLFIVLAIELNIIEKEAMENILQKKLQLNLSHSPSKNDTNKS